MAVELTEAVPTVEIAALTVADVRLRPRVTVVVTRLRATAVVTPLRAADRTAVPRTVADRPMVGEDHPTVEAVGRMEAVAADMGGNTALASFRA